MFLLSIRRSGLQAAILLIFYLGTLYGLKFSALPGLLSMGLVAAISLCFFAELNRLLVRSKHSSLAIHFNDLDVRLIFPRNETRVVLSRISYFSEWLIVLDFSGKHGASISWTRYFDPHRFVALWPDSLSEPDRRRLRRYLLFELN